MPVGHAVDAPVTDMVTGKSLGTPISIFDPHSSMPAAR
jgi:hypothetical protein